MPRPKKIPHFKSEKSEYKFWQKADSTKYIDWNKAQNVTLPKLKPTLKTISLRLPSSMIENLKLLANKKDIPYQSLLKMFLSEKIGQELAK